MSRTQPEIDNLLNQFIGQYAGHSVDYYGYTGECLSLAKRWVDAVRNGHLNGPMGAPPAAAWGSDYWANPPAMINELFERQEYNPNAIYPAGSMFVNTRTHHIGILQSNNPGQSVITAFHQNANPDGSASHTSSRNKSNVDGILVIRVSVPAPVPQAPLFTVEAIAPREVKVNPGARKWNLGHANFNDINANPITTADNDTHFVARAVLHHREIPQYNYYLEDPNTPHGWNVLDCNDYVAPPPPPPVYVPPAPPAKPVTAEPAETYDVITKLMVFPSAADAKTLSNYTNTDLEPGKYFVFNKDANAYNLSTDNVRNQNKWVRITDNVIKPIEAIQPAIQVPTETVNIITLPVDAPATDINIPVDVNPAPIEDSKPKPQYNWIRDDKLPVRLTSTNTAPVPIHDLEGKWPSVKFPGKRTEDYSMFAVHNGQEYWLPDRTRTKGYMYGVPVAFLPDEEPIQPTFMDRNANNRYDIIDIFDTGLGNFIDFSSRSYQRITDVIKPLAPKITPVTKNTKQFIDGFSRKGKK